MATAFLTIAAARRPRRSTPPTAPTSSTFICPTSTPERWSCSKGRRARRARSPRHAASRSSTLVPDMTDPAGAFSSKRDADGAIHRRPPGLRRRRRRRAGAAHLGHHLASEDRAAEAPQHDRVGAQHRPRAAALARTTCASTSCRCSTSTGSSRRRSPASPPAPPSLHAGLQRAAVLRLVRRGRPTWYTAVPTMHQAILARADRAPGAAQDRAGCASSARRPRRLPPQVMQALERPSACR